MSIVACPTCNRQTPSKFELCQYCSNPLVPSATCPKCKHEIPASLTTCKYCGEQVFAKASPPPPPAAAPPPPPAALDALTPEMLLLIAEKRARSSPPQASPPAAAPGGTGSTSPVRPSTPYQPPAVLTSPYLRSLSVYAHPILATIVGIVSGWALVTGTLFTSLVAVVMGAPFFILDIGVVMMDMGGIVRACKEVRALAIVNGLASIVVGLPCVVVAPFALLGIMRHGRLQLQAIIVAPMLLLYGLLMVWIGFCLIVNPKKLLSNVAD